MTKGFWGVRPGAGTAKAALFGPPGPFFRNMLEASRYVELYDEKLRCEPWRRGVRTEEAAPGALKERLAAAGASFACLAGYRQVPAAVLAGSTRITLSPPAASPARRERILGRMRDADTFLVVDPLVMAPGLLAIPANRRSGGLGWYPLVDLLAACFSQARVRAVQILPCRLPRRDTYPAFVLARLVSRILALALCPGDGRRP